MESRKRNLKTSSGEAHIGMTSKNGPPTPPQTSELGSISLLMFLYVLQGIPLGLSASIPMVLQGKGISYKDQATFSLSIWPFSVKLLWAPLVDSVYWATMGRRKSWLVPAQYLIGVFMLIFSMNIESLLGTEEDASVYPNVPLLTTIFFSLNFLAATQDIAVDGWALTMLSRARVGWASTCNSVGQTAGFFLGYVVFLALQSREFCVDYLGFEGAVVDLKGYFYFWGIVFLITTTLVWALKKETDNSVEEQDNEELDLGLKDTYKMLLTIMKKPIIITCIGFLLTHKICFGAADSLTVLKLTEKAVPKEKLALLSIPLTPVQIFLPLVISRYTSGPKPLEVLLKAMPFRVFFSLMFAVVVYVTPSFKDEDGSYPTHYYLFLVFVYLLHQVSTNCMFVSMMSFFARVSDSAVGGTYMTLLNTFANLGGNWPSWVALRYVSDLTWSTCISAADTVASVATCDSTQDKETCLKEEGTCLTSIDGYYVESVVCFFIGILWLKLGSSSLRKLENVPLDEWKVVDRNSKKIKD